MKGYRPLVLGLLVAAGVLAAGAVSYGVWIGGEVLAGFTAKTLCSCVYVSRREAAACLREDLAPYRFTRATVDHDRRRAVASAFLLRRAEAEFRDGEGCTLR